MEVIGVGKSKQIFQVFPEHQHGYWEIMLNLQGSGTICIGGTNYAFQPGDITVIPPNTAHKKESKQGFTDLCMFIKDFRQIGKTGLQHFRDDEAGSVRTVMEMAYRYSSSGIRYEQAAVNVMGDLVYQLLACYYKRSNNWDLRLEGMIEVMERNIPDPHFDLADAINRSGYCKTYFRRMFKAELGKPPAQYFNHLRINHAKSLLQQYGSSRTVKDIAAASGFTDPLYFSRIFKQIEGVSPKAYLEQSQNKDLSPIFMDTPREFVD